jgi:hypothetical protein
MSDESQSDSRIIAGLQFKRHLAHPHGPGAMDPSIAELKSIVQKTLEAKGACHCYR